MENSKEKNFIIIFVIVGAILGVLIGVPLIPLLVKTTLIPIVGMIIGVLLDNMFKKPRDVRYLLGFIISFGTTLIITVIFTILVPPAPVSLGASVSNERKIKIYYRPNQTSNPEEKISVEEAKILVEEKVIDETKDGGWGIIKAKPKINIKIRKFGFQEGKIVDIYSRESSIECELIPSIRVLVRVEEEYISDATVYVRELPGIRGFFDDNYYTLTKVPDRNRFTIMAERGNLRGSVIYTLAPHHLVGKRGNLRGSAIYTPYTMNNLVEITLQRN